MWNPDEPQETKKVERKTLQPATLLPQETNFLWYLSESSEFRLAVGVAKTGDHYTVVDLEKIKVRPEWQKILLRELVKKK